MFNQGCLKIILHNVLHWRTNSLSVRNYYLEEDPDVILINSTGVPNLTPITLVGYVVYQHNITGGRNDGIAILVKKTVKHRLMNRPLSKDFLMVSLPLAFEEICLSTTYSPFRRDQMELFSDLYNAGNMHQPTYVLAENAVKRVNT